MNSPVHCLEHVDYKSVAGGVVAYGDFDSTKPHYLVFHDLKLAIEFPTGTLALYPSSLLAHSNVSLVEADSKEDALAGKGQKRGGLVWFVQANYIVSREIGIISSRLYRIAWLLFQPSAHSSERLSSLSSIA